MQNTTIQINKNTRLRLKKFMIGKRETYDELLNLLMDLVPDGDDEGAYTTEFKMSIIRGLMDIKRGRTYTHYQVKRELGLA